MSGRGSCERPNLHLSRQTRKAKERLLRACATTPLSTSALRAGLQNTDHKSLIFLAMSNDQTSRHRGTSSAAHSSSVKIMNLRLCFLLSMAFTRCHGFVPTLRVSGLTRLVKLNESNDADNDPLGDDDDEIAPGKMRVSEIKAELEVREVDYSDCFDKESLVARLHESRATGKASPKIIEKFNKQKLEETFKEEKLELTDDDLLAATANDGTLPGGMQPEQFKQLISNPEVMALLQSPKVQEAMQLMMTGGRAELESKVKEDPELQETIAKLDSVISGGTADDDEPFQ